MNISAADNALCTGCGACAAICPQSAIHMEKNMEGYQYPVIDSDLCNKCGKCTMVCQKFDSAEGSYVGARAYSFQASDDIRRSSRSGGAAYVLASRFIAEGGIVYGCILNASLGAVHIRATEIKTLRKMQGSKYVESDITNIWNPLQKDLKAGYKVLVIGTTCQINAFSRFFLNEPRLFLIDIICHGVASPLIFREYITYCEKKYRDKICTVDFRNKKYGWKAHIETLLFKSGKLVSYDLWSRIFYSHCSMRPACYTCKKTCHYSDITIGDCWGEKTKDFDNRGTSIIIINSQKGAELSENIENMISIQIEDFMQKPLFEPVKRPENRDFFWELYYNAGFESLIEEFGWISFQRKIRTFIKKIWFSLTSDW